MIRLSAAISNSRIAVRPTRFRDLALLVAACCAASVPVQAAPNLITNSTFEMADGVSGWTGRGGSTFLWTSTDGGSAEFSAGGGTVDDMADHDLCFDISLEPSDQDYFYDGDFIVVGYTPTGNTLGFRFEFHTDTNCTSLFSTTERMGGFVNPGAPFNVSGSVVSPDPSVQSIRVLIGPRAELPAAGGSARADNIEFSIGEAVPVELMSFGID